MNNEMWKDIKNYEGLYQVSNLGRVRSIDRIITLKHKSGKLMNVLTKGKVIAATDNGHGYLITGLSKNNKRKNYYVHRLVAETFIENINNKKEVNHKNGDKNNNNVENLEWVTPKENQIHSSKVLNTKYNLTGLNKSREKQKVKVDMFDLNNNFIKSFNSISEASREVKISPSVICGCCKGIYKTGGGFVWKYT